MDMDNAQRVMDVLRAATEQNEGNTPIDPYKLPVQSNYVSQFCIDSQPILPPVMTAEKRQQMQQLRQQAIELDAKYKQPHAITLTLTVDQLQSSDTKLDRNSSSSSSNSSSKSSYCTINTTQRLPQLQQTETFIYDSTQQQQEQQKMIQANEKEQLSSPQRSRPQTLDIGSTKNVLLPGIIPTIRVNPPTPLQPTSTKPSTLFALSPTVSTALCTPQRKLNNITNRILKFEGTCLEKPVEPLQPEATNMLWQNETLVAGEKRMMRSSTSPALSAAQLDQKQLHRSRSFTLEQPSQALVEHMEREGKSPPSPSPPPVPPLPAELSPRCHIRLSSSSPAVGLAHLRRDTIESRAKQVQHSIKSSTQSPSISPSSSPTTAGADAIARRRGGSSTTARLQHQQKQLEELLQRALHETNDMLTDKEQIEHNKLSLAKRQMFTDIKIAHRDRFQQLVQYQREEQRRMQEEFERQQKFLIDQICTEINVSAYAHEPITTTLTSPSCISEYTSTSDLKTQTSPSNTFTLDSLDMTPRSLEFPSQEDLMHTARKRLFDTDNDSESQLTMLQTTPKPLRQQNVSSSSRSSPPMRNVNQIKKPVQRNQTKTPPSNKKVISPVQSSSKSKSLTPTPARRVGNNSQNNKTTITKNTPPQQTMQMSKTRRSASPSRQTLEMQRRHEAATLLTAATRGFLVRRLFRTEQVQRIVQTIRDTLIFVLNLHMETYGSSLEQEEPSNIRLKARLLQQLCSASRTLHLIFFQTSIKERMEIIARDRKRIKTKLMAMHVKQRQ